MIDPSEIYDTSEFTEAQKESQFYAVNSFEAFIRLCVPFQHLAHCHIELYKWIQEKDHDNKLVLWPRDHGKAQSLTSKVLTPHGWSTIGELRVGDYVIGGNGKPTRVVQLHPVADMQMYEVATRDGRVTKCNSEHLWTVLCPSSTGDALVTKPLSEIEKNYRAIRHDKRNGKDYVEYRYFLPAVAPVEFPHKDLPLDPYTLGLWLGDGHSASGEFTSADPEIVSYIPYTVNKIRSKYRYNILGIKGVLNSLGILKNKHIPESYLFASIEQRTALLQGLMDTDGTVHKEGKWLYFTTASPTIKDGFVALVRSLGGSTTTKDTWKAYEKGGKKFHSYTITVKLPATIQPFRLSRKLEKYTACTGTKSAIVDIRAVGVEAARCITVENEDGLYVTDDYILTHNSRVAAFYAAWHICRNPAITILYASATAEKAEEQLRFIKSILENRHVKKYFPGLLDPKVGQRKLWNNTNIIVDHPWRAKQGIVDSTLMTCGLGKVITGKHFDKLIFDDIVVPENNTEIGRRDVARWFAQAASIASAHSDMLVVGTRYHPKDVYQQMLEMEIEQEDEHGNVTGSAPLFYVSKANVEEDGVFLWPREQTPDGRWFGFNQNILSRKRTIYEHAGEITQFRAQYYNDPHDRDSAPISREGFQYYKRELLSFVLGSWQVENEPLHVYCAVDLAATTKETSDYTVVIVGGIDRLGNIYVMDIDRFRTNKVSEIQESISKMYEKWRFKSLTIEAVAGFKLVAQDLEDRLKDSGVRIPVEHYNPGNQETKRVRIDGILEPLYQAKRVYHFRGGFCELLENELVSVNPAHDDIKDAWAMCCQQMKAPVIRKQKQLNNVVQFNPRFGGLAM